jgi:hypothetical protein
MREGDGGGGCVEGWGGSTPSAPLNAQYADAVARFRLDGVQWDRDFERLVIEEWEAYRASVLRPTGPP